MAKSVLTSVDQYIAAQPPAARAHLEQVRQVIRTSMPEAEEVISYSIPAYRLGGRVALYFAGWKAHFSIYPSTDRLVAAFGKELARYEISKGTIRFPLAEPVPVGLIGKIAKFRVKEAKEREPAKARRTAKARGARRGAGAPADQEKKRA